MSTLDRKKEDVAGLRGDEAPSTTAFATGPTPWSLLAMTVGATAPGTLSQLHAAIASAIAAGARPFEVVAGAPIARYGARVTFTPRGDGRALAEALGITDHPWGIPAWIGVRVRAGEALRAKAYHRPVGWAERFDLPAGLPADLRPRMIARDGDMREIYIESTGLRAWGRFVAEVAAAIPWLADRLHDQPILFAPRPRPVERAFGLGLRWEGDRLAAVSLFADRRALPDEATIRREWAAGLADDDARAHEMALAAVRSLGRSPGGVWHALLGWTFEAGGASHRAASLAVPTID